MGWCRVGRGNAMTNALTARFHPRVAVPSSSPLWRSMFLNGGVEDLRSAPSVGNALMSSAHTPVPDRPLFAVFAGVA